MRLKLLLGSEQRVLKDAHTVVLKVGALLPCEITDPHAGIDAQRV